MIPLSKELNWLLTIILFVDKGSASAVCVLKTLISPIDWQINITLCKTITLPSWWIVLSVTRIGHFSFKRGTRTPRITKRSKERSKERSKRDPEPAAARRDGHGANRAWLRSTKTLRKGPNFRSVRELAPMETNEKGERTQNCSEEKGWPPELSWQTQRGIKYAPEIAVC